MEKDLIFESFRNCVSDQKCKGCEWKACKVAQCRKVGIPVDLAFAVISLMADLLKEQEAVEPIERNGFYYCGACRYALMTNHQKYCSDCGKKMKWE